MLTQTLDTARLGVIGLGYVGLPVAVEFGKNFAGRVATLAPPKAILSMLYSTVMSSDNDLLFDNYFRVESVTITLYFYAAEYIIYVTHLQ